MSGKVLVSGAGIAGCCVAWWLQRYGFDVTVVDQAMRPRDGGYVIDFWGIGYEVAERMGLVDELRRHDLDIHEFRIVDARGRRITSIDQGALGELTGGKVMSLPRAAVASTLYDALGDRVPVRFGNSITGLTDGPDGVDVQFEHGKPERFDLVIGADGLHSAVRRLLFGDESAFERYLGYCVAAFSTTGYQKRDLHAYVTYGEPGRQIWRIASGDDTTVFLLVFAEAEPPAIPMRDVAQQKAVLVHRYAGGAGETDAVLRALDGAADLYFDRVSQIAVPEWSKGRIVLIGDACACPSLLAGEGSAMAMAEAYVLAGELHEAGGDHARAFAAYERRLRPYVERKQKGARGFATGFVPMGAFGLWTRNTIIDLVGRLGLTRWLFGAQLNDRLTLPTYECGTATRSDRSSGSRR